MGFVCQLDVTLWRCSDEQARHESCSQGALGLMELNDGDVKQAVTIADDKCLRRASVLCVLQGSIPGPPLLLCVTRSLHSLFCFQLMNL